MYMYVCMYVCVGPWWYGEELPAKSAEMLQKNSPYSVHIVTPWHFGH